MKSEGINNDIFYFWDIETSKVKHDNAIIEYDQNNKEIFDSSNYVQVVYLSNVYSQRMDKGTKIDSVFHRTLDGTIEYLNTISNEDNKIVVYVHNLDYELSFLLKHTKASAIMNVDNVDYYGGFEFENILREKHSPLSITLDILPNVIFRDSYALFNKTVKQLGKDLVKRGEDLPKLEYDYTITRLPWDELDQLDYDYNERDNIIVARSIYNYLKDRNMKAKNIPLTFTSATKVARRKYIQDNFTNAIRTLNIDKINVVDHYNFYQVMLDAYQGGLTTACPKHINKLNKNVYAIDIKSSYPYQMVSRRFPIFLKENTYHLTDDIANDFYHDFLHLYDFKTLGTVKSPSNIKGYYVRCIIENIRIKNDEYLLPLSTSFCENELSKTKYQSINGKIRHAEQVCITCSNVFLDTLNLAYDYDNIYVYELYATDKSRRLRESEISYILNCYDKKENETKNTLEYALAKIGINAQYGIKVQRVIKDKYIVADGEVHTIKYNELDDKHQDLGISKKEVFERFNIFNENRFIKHGRFSKDFDIFSDGTFITEFGRYQLIEMMLELHNNDFISIYADTDSLKFYKKNARIQNTDTNKNTQLIITEILEKVNSNIIKQNSKNIRFNTYKENNNLSEGNFCKLIKIGTWDIENIQQDNKIVPYAAYKTLGAKKYAYITYEEYNQNDTEKFKKLKKLLKEINDTYDYKQGDLVPVIETIIAGCSKEVNKSIMLYANNKNVPYHIALNIIFDCGTLFDESCAGRTIAFREKRDLEECKQLTYKGRKLNSGGGIIIQSTTYLLNVSKNDGVILHIDRDTKPVRFLNNKGELTYYEY